MKHKKALAIGGLDIDQIHYIDGYPEEDSKVQPAKSLVSLGGPACAGAITLAKLGIDTTFIATIGKDRYGSIAKERLGKHGVRFIPIYDTHTKVNTVLINRENGSRTIIKGSVKHKPLEKISERIIRKADIILFDRREPKVFEEVIKKKRKDTKIVIDPSNEVSPKIAKMLEHTDFPIVPIEFLSEFQRHADFESSLKQLYKKLRKTVVVTTGELGCLVYDGKTVTVIPSFEVNVIDTNGAGDVFRGGFAFGLLKEWDVNKCARFANVVAALQCQREGNETAVPEKKEVELMDKNGKEEVVSLMDVKNEFSNGAGRALEYYSRGPYR